MSVHLVAGGSGYFGGVLVKELLARGKRVRILDLNQNDDMPGEVEFVQGDVRDRRQIQDAFNDVEVLYNVVAQVPLAKDKQLFHSVNVEGNVNLFNLALENNVKKCIHVSSSAIFGVPKENPVHAHTPANPQDPYGKAKYEAELKAQDFINQGLDLTMIRPRTILGHNRLGIFSILFDWVYHGFNVPVLGAGDNLYQFIHAKDLATGCILAAEKTGPAVYNMGAEKFGTMRELLQTLIVHAKMKGKVRSLPFGLTVMLMKLTSQLGLTPLAPYHWLMYGRSMYFDITKAKAELNWQPEFSNEQMICESYDCFCKENVGQKSYEGASAHQSKLKEGLLNVVKHCI